MDCGLPAKRSSRCKLPPIFGHTVASSQNKVDTRKSGSTETHVPFCPSYSGPLTTKFLLGGDPNIRGTSCQVVVKPSSFSIGLNFELLGIGALFPGAAAGLLGISSGNNAISLLLSPCWTPSLLSPPQGQRTSLWTAELIKQGIVGP